VKRGGCDTGKTSTEALANPGRATGPPGLPSWETQQTKRRVKWGWGVHFAAGGCARNEKKNGIGARQDCVSDAVHQINQKIQPKEQLSVTGEGRCPWVKIGRHYKESPKSKKETKEGVVPGVCGPGTYQLYEIGRPTKSRARQMGKNKSITLGGTKRKKNVLRAKKKIVNIEIVRKIRKEVSYRKTNNIPEKSSIEEKKIKSRLGV